MKLLGASRAKLCRTGEQSCGACCWGRKIERQTLAARLERQRRIAQSWASKKMLPPRWRLLLHELRARRGLDLLLLALLRLPWFSARLRPWIAERTACAFVAVDSSMPERVGCLLHPARWHGTDLRAAVAFRLLPGLGCGSPDFACRACQRFSQASHSDQELQLHQLTAHAGDWFAYSNAIVQLSSLTEETPAHAGHRL